MLYVLASCALSHTGGHLPCDSAHILVWDNCSSLELCQFPIASRLLSSCYLEVLSSTHMPCMHSGNGSRGGSHRNVPSTFSGLKQYNKHFEQLLAQEIYAQVQRQVSEAGLGTSFACTVSGIVRKDEYWEVSATVRTAGYQVCGSCLQWCSGYGIY